MVTPGFEAKKVSPTVIVVYIVRALQRVMPPSVFLDHEVIDEYTVSTLQLIMPPVVHVVVFLSSGQSEEQATVNLNAVNQLKTKKPWSLWVGNEENIEKEKVEFLARCKTNFEATLGTYKGDVVQGEGVSESLHVKGLHLLILLWTGKSI